MATGIEPRRADLPAALALGAVATGALLGVERLAARRGRGVGRGGKEAGGDDLGQLGALAAVLGAAVAWLLRAAAAAASAPDFVLTGWLPFEPSR